MNNTDIGNIIEVVNCPNSWGDREIQTIFSQYGKITSTELKKNDRFPNSQTAIVCYINQLSCVLAISALDNQEFGGMNLKVQMKKASVIPIQKTIAVVPKKAPKEKTNEPCSYFILGNCNKECKKSHEGLLEIKECPCCKHDVLGQCKYQQDSAKCWKKHNCCKSKYEAIKRGEKGKPKQK